MSAFGGGARTAQEFEDALREAVRDPAPFNAETRVATQTVKTSGGRPRKLRFAGNLGRRASLEETREVITETMSKRGNGQHRLDCCSRHEDLRATEIKVRAVVYAQIGIYHAGLRIVTDSARAKVVTRPSELDLVKIGRTGFSQRVFGQFAGSPDELPAPFAEAYL